MENISTPEGASAAEGCWPAGAAGAFTDMTAASRLSLWLNSQSAARSRLPLQALSAASACAVNCRSKITFQIKAVTHDRDPDLR